MKKMDEMERHIQLLAQERAYKILMLALCGWTLYNLWQTWFLGGEGSLLPGLLLCGAMAVQHFSQLAFQKEMVQGEEDYHEPVPLSTWVVLAVAVANIVLGVGVWLLKQWV